MGRRRSLRKTIHKEFTYRPKSQEEFSSVVSSYLETRADARLQFVFLHSSDQRYDFHQYLECYHPEIPRKSSFLSFERKPRKPSCDGSGDAPCECTPFVIESLNDVTKQTNKNGVLLGRKQK